MKLSKTLPGLIVVISSPSGTGKTTICRRLLKLHSDFLFSISVTTRPPRAKEKNGIDYNFVTDVQFDRMFQKRELAEWANVFDYRYGTPRSQIDGALKGDKVLLCDVDIQGGMAIKRKFKDAVTIFVIPPSLTELKRRLFKRRTESAGQKKLRLKTALNELRYWPRYDYVVLNDDLKVATNEVDMIIAAERAKTRRMKNRRFWSGSQRKLLQL